MAVLPYRAPPVYVGANLDLVDPRLRAIALAGEDTRLIVQFRPGIQGRPVICTPSSTGAPVYAHWTAFRNARWTVDLDTGYAPTSELYLQFGITVATTSEQGLFVKLGGESGADGVGLGIGLNDADTPGNNLLFLMEGVSWIPNVVTHSGATIPIGTGFHTVSIIRSYYYSNATYFFVDGNYVNSFGGFTPTPANAKLVDFNVRNLSSGVKVHYGIIGKEGDAASRHDVQNAMAAQFFPAGREPVLIFPRRRRVIYIGSVAGGAVTGTLSSTEGADTAAMSGTETFTGTLAATEGADTCSMSGVTGAGIIGTLAVTEGADSATASGTVSAAPITGTLSATEGADSATATGLVAAPVTGTLAATEGADRCTMVGIGGISAQGLAELYGGGLFAEDKRKKKEKKPKKPPLEIMVRAVAAEPEGKKAVIRALPRRTQQFFPDPQIAIVSDLVTRIEAASQPVKREIERLYEKKVRQDEDDEEDDLFILLM